METAFNRKARQGKSRKVRKKYETNQPPIVVLLEIGVATPVAGSQRAEHGEARRQQGASFRAMWEGPPKELVLARRLCQQRVLVKPFADKRW